MSNVILSDEDKKTLAENSINSSNEFRFKHNNELKKVNIIKLKNLSTNCNQIVLRADEILFLNYIDGKHSDLNTTPGYWSDTYNLDFHNTLERLLLGGYLKFSDYTFNMTKCTVSELKLFAKQNNIKVTGKKDNIINTILKSTSESILNSHFNCSYFLITDVGKKIIKENEYIIITHKYKEYIDVSIYDAEQIKQKYDGLSDYEIIARAINEKVNCTPDGRYRNYLFGKSVLEEEFGNMEAAIKYKLSVCFFDSSDITKTFIVDNSYFSKTILLQIKKLFNENRDVIKSELRDLYFKSISELPFETIISKIDIDAEFYKFYEVFNVL